jgi:hypothetical protein
MIKMNSYQVGVFDPSVAAALVRGVLEVLVAELVLADEFALAGFELPVERGVDGRRYSRLAVDDCVFQFIRAEQKAAVLGF